eukprot:scaffold203863_cov36-Prasinocladus_malaysianus.AAC.2
MVATYFVGGRNTKRTRLGAKPSRWWVPFGGGNIESVLHYPAGGHAHVFAIVETMLFSSKNPAQTRNERT